MGGGCRPPWSVGSAATACGSDRRADAVDAALGVGGLCPGCVSVGLDRGVAHAKRDGPTDAGAACPPGTPAGRRGQRRQDKLHRRTRPRIAYADDGCAWHGGIAGIHATDLRAGRVRPRHAAIRTAVVAAAGQCAGPDPPGIGAAGTGERSLRPGGAHGRHRGCRTTAGHNAGPAAAGLVAAFGPTPQGRR